MKKLKSKVKYIVFGLIAVALVFALLLLWFNSKSNAYNVSETKSRSNYMEVKSVPGVVFEVSKDLSDYATAVMEISKDIDFIKNASYSYGNGEDMYILFNMSQYIVIVNKGTNFALDQTSVEESLKNHSLNGIWFEKKGGISSKDDKWIIDVTAQVVITNQIYNDFTGKLAVIKKGDTEWSMFVGAVNPNDATLTDMIKYTAGTFAYYSGTENAFQAVYEVETQEEGNAQLVAVEEKTPEPAAAPIPKEKQEPEELPKEEGQEVEKNGQEAEEESQESQLEETEPSIVPDMVVGKTNQKRISYDDAKAYTSSVYNMLSPGQIGYASAINQASGQYDDIFVKVTAYNDEETTIKLIEKHINSGNAYYDSIEAPLGTHWESVTYDVKGTNGNSYYMNVQLVGFDGEKLKYRGIAYSKRSYDITDAVYSDGDWEKGYVAFFAVPNGCSEYAVACGDANKIYGFKAYYQVKK